MSDFCYSDDTVPKLRACGSKDTNEDDYLDRFRARSASRLDLVILASIAAIFFSAVLVDWSVQTASVPTVKAEAPMVVASPIPFVDRCDTEESDDDQSCQ